MKTKEDIDYLDRIVNIQNIVLLLQVVAIGTICSLIVEIITFAMLFG